MKQKRKSNNYKQCLICEERFTSIKETSEHTKTCLKRVKCPSCGKPGDCFGGKILNFNVHKRHCKNGKLFCPLCDKIYVNGESIKVVTDHYNKCCQKKLYQECRRCKTKLPSLKALADHCRLHHPDQSCEMCGAHFAIYEHLEQHKRDVHNA